MKHSRILDDIYAISINDLAGKELQHGYHLLYAPKAGATCVVDDAFVQQLRNGDAQALAAAAPLRSTALWDSVGEEADSPASAGILYILPNYKCNLSCTYCYAAKGRSSEEIQKDRLLEAVDAFFDDAAFKLRVPGQKLRLTFMGGGEPLLSWPPVKECIQRAGLRARESGRGLLLSIITNGTILTDDILATLKEYGVRVNVSFDITPELQAKQRGRHEHVSRNIQRMLEEGVAVLVRSTITPESAPHLPHVAEYAATHFPLLRKLAFEPVTDPGLPAETLRSFLACFRRNFFEARRWLSGKGVTLACSDYLSARQPARKHCPGSVSLNPRLSLTACPCFSSPQEEGYEGNIVGDLKDARLHIDPARYRDAMPGVHALPPECADCFAKWNCAGGCVHQRLVYTPEQMHEICTHTRRMLRRILLEKADAQMTAATGRGLAENLV